MKKGLTKDTESSVGISLNFLIIEGKRKLGKRARAFEKEQFRNEVLKNIE